MKFEAHKTIAKMREKSTLIHHITNWVTINDCAQIVRRWGCLPVMAHAKEEVAEMVSLAGALVLNIGTLTMDLVDSMIVAGKSANKKRIPVILDAVGVGATRLRTEQAKRLLDEVKIDILKGNAGEIATLAGVEAEVKGVESISVSADAGETAKLLAKKLGNIVAITGAVDFVSDGGQVLALKYGHPLMGEVVGTGCVCTSTIGCFASIGEDYLHLTAQALGCFGVAGERTCREASAGDFMWRFFNVIDEISKNPNELEIIAEER